MADKKISQLDATQQVNSDAVFPFSQLISGSDETQKATVGQIGDYIANEKNYSGLNTTAKDLIGAINEIAAGGGGGGGFIPTFSETVLVDNSSENTSFSFRQSFNNYDFLKVKIHNYGWQQYFTILTTPASINAIMDITSFVNFNDFANNQYCCYSFSSDRLTWSRSYNRNCNIVEIVGLNCTNATVSKTQIYKAASVSGNSVPVTTQENLLDYDWIMFSANDSSDDELQPCYNIFIKSESDYINELKNQTEHHYIFSGYNYSFILQIAEHSIQDYVFAYIEGIKFTPI